VAVDGNGDVVVAGRFKDTVDFGGDPLTAAGASDAFVARYAGGSGAHMDSLRFGAEGNDLASAVSTNGTRTVVSGAFEDTVAFGGNSLSAADGADLFLLQVEQ